MLLFNWKLKILCELINVNCGWHWQFQSSKRYYSKYIEFPQQSINLNVMIKNKPFSAFLARFSLVFHNWLDAFKLLYCSSERLIFANVRMDDLKNTVNFRLIESLLAMTLTWLWLAQLKSIKIDFLVFHTYLIWMGILGTNSLLIHLSKEVFLVFMRSN